jgi:citrate synthase
MEATSWKSALTDTSGSQLRIRGLEITQAMENLSFGATVFLLWVGRLPSEGEARIMDAILVSSVDHGVTPPSALATRVVRSGGNPLNAAVAAGILAIGDSHGGAIEQCARLFQERLKTRDEGPEIGRLATIIVEEFQEKQKRLPGYGHRIYKRDPRTVKLFQIAEREGMAQRGVALALAIQDELEKRSEGKPLPVNVDGAIAALMTDLGIDWRLGKGFFILSRTAGLVAHAFEEGVREKPMRSFGHSLPEYDGPKDLTL